MSIEAFLRQGFIPFRDAVGRETDVLTSAAPSLMERATDAAHALGTPAHATFVGIGASLAALAAPAAFLSVRGVSSSRMNAVEASESSIAGTLIALSQSGRSRETVAVMRNARGPKLAIVNVTGSPITKAADAVLSLGNLPDSLASTIGFTASVMAVSMLCEAWTNQAPAQSWLSIGERIGTFLAANANAVEAVADLMSRSTSIDFVAPHEHLGIAEGGALLIREVARKPTAPFETRQYLHGLMEATSPTTMHIVVDGPDDGQIVRALSSLHRDIVEFRTTPTGTASKASIVVTVATASPLELPIFVAAFLQHAVLRSALARDIDPDEVLFLDTGTKLGDGE
jgi:glucosamine--fructose-6-phosphate aminotransferase (isomerizing)